MCKMIFVEELKEYFSFPWINFCNRVKYYFQKVRKFLEPLLQSQLQSFTNVYNASQQAETREMKLSKRRST